MSPRKRILNSSLLFWFFAAVATSALGATELKPDLANWDNLKTLSRDQVVKVVMTDMKAYKCLFRSVGDDAITVEMKRQCRFGSSRRGCGGAPQQFARENILRVSQKIGSHRLRNALIGAAIGGAALGGPFVAGDTGDLSRAGLLAVGWGFGSLIGGGVGASLPSEVWRDVYRAR